MSSAPTSSSPHAQETAGQTKRKPSRLKRFFQIIAFGLLILVIFAAWQFLNAYNNSTGPSVAGRPLSNPHTHLHSVVLGAQPGVLYLGTHDGLFKSTDGGHTWTQPRGELNNFMVTSIAENQLHNNFLALIVIPTSGVGQQSGVAFSQDNGINWQISSPPGLSISAYPYEVKAGTGSDRQFYAFYFYAGWLETRDLGTHWYPITKGYLANLQVSTLLTDTKNPNHLYLGGDQGLFESFDDGDTWLHIATIQGNIPSIIATNSTPRLVYCATDQRVYRWQEGSNQVKQITYYPMPTTPTRLVVDKTGEALYGVSGQDLWFCSDSWEHRLHFDRSALISFVLDPQNPNTLYAGFFLPPEVIYSRNGGSSWQTLTD